MVHKYQPSQTGCLPKQTAAFQDKLAAFQEEINSKISAISNGQSEFEETITDTLNTVEGRHGSD
jgi:hypothetical protein